MTAIAALEAEAGAEPGEPTEAVSDGLEFSVAHLGELVVGLRLAASWLRRPQQGPTTASFARFATGGAEVLALVMAAQPGGREALAELNRPTVGTAPNS